MEELIKPQNLTLSREQMAMLMPYLLLSLGGILTIIASVLHSSKTNLYAASITVITLLAALWSVTNIWGEPTQVLFNGMLSADYFSSLFNVVLMIATLLVVLSSYPYLEREGIHHAEYYSLTLFSCLGMMLLSSSLDLVVLFIS